MEQLEMNVNNTDEYLLANGYGEVQGMSPKLEARFGRLMLAKEVEEGSAPAIAFAAGKPIPRNCLPPPTKKAEVVTGNQYLVLISLQSKPKNRATIADEIGAPRNSVSASLATLKQRHLIHTKRKQKRTKGHGASVCVYGISRAGLIALKACDE